jgi:hypothetical protein
MVGIASGRGDVMCEARGYRSAGAGPVAHAA